MQYEYRNKEIIVIFDYFDQRKLWDMIRECDTASGGVTPQTPADEISGRGEICACIFGENRVYYTGTCRCVGIGRRSGLKIHRWQHRAGSSPATGTTSEQSPLCSDVFLCLWQKRRHPPAPLLLLSKSNPLRWASIWYWVQIRKFRHLYCFDIPNQSTNFDTKTPFHFGGLFLRLCPEPQYSCGFRAFSVLGIWRLRV